MTKLIITIISLSFVTVLGESLPDPLEAGWQGKKVCEKLHEDDKQRILRCTFAPGIGHEKHYHAPNFGYTIQGGTVKITDANGIREVTIKTGDSHVSPDGTPWHEIVNVGDTTIIYLVVEVK